jgi:periplasmic copper chaperone A
MKILFAALASLALAGPALAQQAAAAAAPAQSASLPAVEGAWVRATLPGQQATGVFMRITARESMQLVGVSTPVAGVAELHEMKMEGSVMRMRAIDKLDLPAGKPVELKPGGYHLMLQDLKKPLEAGAKVPLTLVLRDARGTQSQMQLDLPVAAQVPGGAPMQKH